MPEVTTVGKVLFNRALPEKYRDEGRELDAKGLVALLSDIAKDDPESYVDVLQNVSDVSRALVSDYGRTASTSLSDLRLPSKIHQFRESLRQRVEDIYQDSALSPDEKSQRITKVILPEMAKVQKMLTSIDKDKNSFVQRVVTGARGNPSQLMQLMFGDMLVVDHMNRVIPIPGLHSYGEGVTPMEYWAASYGSRKGYADVQFATADSGFFGKQLTQAAHRVVVTENDCGAKDVGIPVSGDDPDNVGSILVSSNIPGIPAGTEIGKEHLKKLEGKEIIVRSSVTCQAHEGICSKCAGRRESGEFPDIGDAIGVTAARAVAEPTTQSGLSSKHSGGVAGQDDRKIFGFKAIDQFVQVPKNFVGSAALSEKEGSVAKIEKAPQGGSYVFVGDTPHYVPADGKVVVKPGQKVEEGDVLSDGVPNPADVVRHKGLGEGRRYFMEKYRQILSDSGAGNHRRNVEALSRGFIDRVRITDPEGFYGHFVDDVVSYDDLVRDYEPRKGYKISRPDSSIGKYLERPVLHYSIGTKITPSMAKRLSSSGIGNILVHDEQPPFEPFVSRIQDISATDKDWMSRMAGFNLQKSLLQAVQRGSESELGGTSYVPSVISGQEIYSNIHKQR